MLTLISSDMGDALAELSGVDFPVWITYLLVYIVIIVLSLTVAIKKITCQYEKQSMRRKPYGAS